MNCHPRARAGDVEKMRRVGVWWLSMCRRAVVSCVECCEVGTVLVLPYVAVANTAEV